MEQILKGRVKAIQVTTIYEGMKVFTNLGVGTVISGLKSSEGYYAVGFREKGIEDFKINELKTLYVEYEDQQHIALVGIAKPKIKQIPLIYSQWQLAIDINKVDTNKTIEFEIESTCKCIGLCQKDNPAIKCTSIARILIIPNKIYTESDIPFEAISAVLDYCEDNQIYDKLGNYNHFYYRLKLFFDNHKR